MFLNHATHKWQAETDNCTGPCHHTKSTLVLIRSHQKYFQCGTRLLRNYNQVYRNTNEILWLYTWRQILKCAFFLVEEWSTLNGHANRIDVGVRKMTKLIGTFCNFWISKNVYQFTHTQQKASGKSRFTVHSLTPLHATFYFLASAAKYRLIIKPPSSSHTHPYTHLLILHSLIYRNALHFT
jgi:hypothetical protein